MFHVQTEDSGVDNPHVFTHLFNGGVIISTRKLVYEKSASEDAVKALMQAQHKAMLKDLKKGSFDEKISQYFANDPNLLPPGRRPANDTNVDGVPEEVSEQSSVSAAIMATASSSVPTRPPEEPKVIEPPRAAPPPPVLPPPIIPAPVVAPPPVARAAPNVHDTARFGSREAPKPGSVPSIVVGLSSTNRAKPPSVDPIPVHDTLRVPFAPQPGAPQKPMDPKSITGEYQIVRRNTLSPPTPANLRPPTPAHGIPAPPSPAQGKPSGKQRRPDAGGVVVSRPAVVVGAAPKPVGAPATGRPRRTREDSRVLFGRELISERSLDEVILAYLGEDSGED